MAHLGWWRPEFTASNNHISAKGITISFLGAAFGRKALEGINFAEGKETVIRSEKRQRRGD